MRAMVLSRLAPLAERSAPLELVELPTPAPGPGEVLIEVSACGVCHTEIDEIEGRAPPPRLPVVPGHQAVGRVCARGPGATRWGLGDRVGVGWIHSSCGGPAENLSDRFRATGRDVDGGYAEYLAAPEDYAFAIPDAYDDVTAAPLLCAGAIGYRSLRLAGLVRGGALGLTGFGASAHLVLPLARHLYPDLRVYVFARDERTRAFARRLGADWAGDTAEPAPEKLDACIDTTPAWGPVVSALANLRPGGRLVINAIRKEDADRDRLAEIDYSRHLWMEREIKSVANITGADLRDFLPLAAEIPLRPAVETYPLEAANEALQALRKGGSIGAKILIMR